MSPAPALVRQKWRRYAVRPPSVRYLPVRCSVCHRKLAAERSFLAWLTPNWVNSFLLHMLPSGFHRIRHYGLLANANRKHDIPTVRELLHEPVTVAAAP